MLCILRVRMMVDLVTFKREQEQGSLEGMTQQFSVS